MGKNKEVASEHSQRINKVLDYVLQNIDSDLGLDELAEVAFQSPHHFGRIFQAQTGRRPIAHVRQFRLTRAAISLRVSTVPIVEIALEAGYANHESFSRAFRRHFGMAPREFRRFVQAQVSEREQLTMTEFKIGLVKIPVTDFAAATEFYRETLGLEEEFAVEAYGWAQYKVAPVPLCLYVVGMGGGDGIPGGEQGFHLTVAKLSEFHTEYSARGGKSASDLVESADGGIFVVLEDPDGNRFKVIQRVK